MESIKFRLVVRGTDSEGRRVRRVRTVETPTYEKAWHEFGEDHAQDMADGLRDLSYSVLPPIGWCVDGSTSRGFEAA
jgi:hypothetical protein